MPLARLEAPACDRDGLAAALVDGLAQLTEQGQRRAAIGFELGLVDDGAGAALLGRVHGVVGCRNQRREVVAAGAGGGDAETGRDQHVRERIVALDPGDRLAHFLGALAGRHLGAVGQQDGEFVAAQTRHDVARAQVLGDALRGLDIG